MSVSVIVEDGTGRADANAYVAVADCDTYHAGRLYASAWTNASSDDKARAVITATVVIDATFQFHGWKKNPNQLLMWPRLQAVDPDRDIALVPVSQSTIIGTLQMAGQFFDENTVPQQILKATCELARELLTTNRLADPDGQGMDSLDIHNAIKIRFNLKTAMPLVPLLVQNMLAPLGEFAARGGGTARLSRA
jgi:hypothetical protein